MSQDVAPQFLFHLDKYLLSTYHLPGTLLGAIEEVKMNKASLTSCLNNQL